MKPDQERPYRRKISQVTDIQVSKNKFQREVDIFKASINSYHSRGIFMIHASFPCVYVVFTVPRLGWTQVALMVRIDFVNYDVDAPSLVFVHPYNLEPVSLQKIGSNFTKLEYLNGQWHPKENLLLAYTLDDIPFMCMEGVREYHLHPGHLGNSWLLHRKKGKGTLGFLVDQIFHHGILTLAKLPPYGKLAGYNFLKK